MSAPKKHPPVLTEDDSKDEALGNPRKAERHDANDRHGGRRRPVREGQEMACVPQWMAVRRCWRARRRTCFRHGRQRRAGADRATSSVVPMRQRARDALH
jgi:hypothetical protein